jgi:pheophorbide a oxygenase
VPQHGWQFAGSGAAQEIPQSEPGTPMATACASKRSCAQSFPTAQAHGLLWVWLEGGSEAAAQAAAVPLPTLPPTDEQGREWFQVSTW